MRISLNLFLEFVYVDFSLPRGPQTPLFSLDNSDQLEENSMRRNSRDTKSLLSQLNLKSNLLAWIGKTVTDATQTSNNPFDSQ